MAKAKTAYVCTECGTEHMQWQGQCISCGEWNVLSRVTIGPVKEPARGFAGAAPVVQKLSEIQTESVTRLGSGYEEFDRVLGGGFVPGSVVLMGGEPGAGKSTLLIQVATAVGSKAEVLYVTGEESLEQLAMRANRLGLKADTLTVASETNVENVAAIVGERKPALVIIDSIQVMQLVGVDSVPGSVSQVRECAAYLTRLAKATGTIMVLVGHVTKEGNLAGPKILEHMIDCFVMLECPPGSRFRTLRGQKNRFGAVNELGVFAMTDRGMKEVSNPSAIFLQRPEVPAPGSVATVLWEGTRPLLVELQALVDEVQGGYPKRVAVGLDAQRLAMHLAVLHRHCGISLNDQDVFANVVGGVRATETATDLAVLLAVLASFRDKVLPQDVIVFGEIGLTGEIRPVPNGEARLNEARKHGFKTAILPFGNQPKKAPAGMTIHGVKGLHAALDVVFN